MTDILGTHDAQQVIHCRRCLMSSARPRVSFDSEGVCNACRFAEHKWTAVDWPARQREFEQLIAPYRGRGRWDCIVPWSGGKDSSAIAWRLKFEFGMNPLLVTFSPQVPTETGVHNREQLIKAGFDHLFFRPNQKVHRRLARRFFLERGNHKVAWDAGINAVPVQAAVNYRIPLVFYAEHGESEYGGRVLSEESTKYRDFTEVIEHQIGDDPRNWIDEEIDDRALAPYIYPATEDVRALGLKAVYFGYFFKWSSYENYLFIKEKIDFRESPEGRTEGTFTSWDSLDDKSDDLYYHMQYVKFGFGRATRDASRMIQNRQLTRDEGLRLARLYDHEFPQRYLPEMLEYLGFSEAELIQLIDRHRNAEIWKKTGDSWELRHPLE